MTDTPRSELERQIQLQRKISEILADRLALCLAWFQDESIEAWLDEGRESLAYFDSLRAAILKQDDASLYRAAQLRGSEFYEPSKDEVRELIRDILRSLKTKTRKAA